MLQDEYYVIERENNDQYPLFQWNQPSGRIGLGKPVDLEQPIELQLSDPVSPNFQWADFHKSPEPTISDRLHAALAPLDVYGVQYLKAKVTNRKAPDAPAAMYWLMHVWNQIHCLDKSLSQLERYKSGRIFGINRLVLDESILGRFELRRRLVFELAEKAGTNLIHQSVKEVIESVSPAGLRFFRVGEWNTDVCFH